MPTAAEFAIWRKRLWDELVHLHSGWDEYEQLFESPERVRMLNACAGWFFGFTQRLILRETILGVSRLTDPRKQRSHSNLVLDILLEDPALESDPETRVMLAAAIEEAREVAKPIRKHRDKYIAHLDHATAIGNRDEPLPGLPRGSFRAVIEKMEAAYNLHGSRLHEAHAFFDLSPLGSSTALIRILEQSDRWRRVQELEERRIAREREPDADAP